MLHTGYDACFSCFQMKCSDLHILSRLMNNEPVYEIHKYSLDWWSTFLGIVVLMWPCLHVLELLVWFVLIWKYLSLFLFWMTVWDKKGIKIRKRRPLLWLCSISADMLKFVPGFCFFCERFLFVYIKFVVHMIVVYSISLTMPNKM